LRSVVLSQRSEDIYTSPNSSLCLGPKGFRITRLVWMSSFHYDMTTPVREDVLTYYLLVPKSLLMAGITRIKSLSMSGTMSLAGTHNDGLGGSVTYT